MTWNTTAFLAALTERVNGILPCYYEEASTGGSFPYAVVNGIKVTDLGEGDLVSFYIDLWGDEKDPETTVKLEELCDRLRNELAGCVLADPGVFACHLGFESQSAMTDGEFDIAHRRLSMSARSFYH